MAVTVTCNFALPQSADEVWRALGDVADVAQCFPGASKIERVDERACKGVVLVKLGPMQLEFSGQFAFTELNEAEHIALATAQGQDRRGRGAAASKIRLQVEPRDTGSVTTVHAETELTGTVAQFGRATSVIQAVAQTLIAEFARNLETRLSQRSNPASAATPAGSPDQQESGSAEPVAAGQAASGLKLIGGASRRWLKDVFGSEPNKP